MVLTGDCAVPTGYKYIWTLSVQPSPVLSNQEIVLLILLYFKAYQTSSFPLKSSGWIINILFWGIKFDTDRIFFEKFWDIQRSKINSLPLENVKAKLIFFLPSKYGSILSSSDTYQYIFNMWYIAALSIPMVYLVLLHSFIPLYIGLSTHQGFMLIFFWIALY